MFNTVPNTEGNPIFSSYSTRTKGFNENMDEYVKAPNDLYIEEQKKKNQQIVGDVNKKALNDIPDMPKFLEEEYEDIQKMPKWFEELNVATPQEIEEWKNKGGMGIAEAWEKNNKWASFAPYINTTRDAADAITASVLLNRAKNGEELSLEQKEKLVDYLRDMKELEVRGFTFGGGTVNAILASIPYLEEFGIGLAAAGEGVGLASLGKTLSTIGAKRAARKAVEQSLKAAAIKSAAPAAVKTTIPLSAAKKIYRDTLTKTTTTQALRNVGTREALTATAKSLPSVVGSSAKFAVTKMPHSLMGGIAERQISSGVYVSDAGSAVFSDSENLALSVMKSLAETTFEALTETAGWAFSPVVNYIAKPVRNILPKRFFTEFEKLVTSRYGMPAANALKKYGYDGVIEEMGEELLNRFLCQVFGLNGLEEYNFDGFMNNVLYANDPSQWAQEALSFAAVGAAGHSVAGAGSRIADEWRKRNYNRNLRELTDRANRYINSPMERYSDEMRKAQQERLERFYLEQGLVKIRGSQSLAEKKLREIWTSQNVDESLQDDILKDMSELDIRKELKKTIENTSNLTKEEASERIIKDLTNKFIDNKTFRNEKDAKTVAALFAAPLQKLSETTGMSLEEVMEEEMPEIQREAEQAARDNGRYVQVDGRIEEIFNELSELPDNFNDEKYLERLMKEVDILSKARDGILTDAEREEAIQFANILQQNGEIEFANELKEILNIEGGEQLFQSASSAGAENNEIEAAQKEWEEKGTESKYFKKWFGASKVVDENGEPLVVYHGTTVSNIEIFEPNRASTDFDYPEAIYFSDSLNIAKTYGDTYHKNPMQVYLKMENPLELDAQGQTYNDFYDELKRELKYAVTNNDGVIVRNIRDDWAQNDGGEIATTYIVFNPEQIKAVNNYGTFDAENPNIYYQSEINRENIETSFGDTLENITDAVRADVLNIAVENNLSEDEFNFEDIRVYGSYSKGQNKDTSDLDFLVQYSGSMREDDAFNMFADAELTLEDVNGNTVKIDINPVNIAKSGTIDEHLVDMDALYQEDNNKLIMAHATKAERIDDIIESGEFVAPSLSITRKGSAELSTKKFGDVLFLRNPRRIDFQNDNIYDRDIYSPRLPEPDYKLTNGTTVNAYEYSSMQREWKGNPERFIQRYGKSFDEYFKDAEKVLFMGYTSSGNRRYKPYKPNFILEYIKKNKLVGGENANYGLSSFLARLAKKQTSKDLLKRAANEGLQDRENTEEEYNMSMLI